MIVKNVLQKKHHQQILYLLKEQLQSLNKLSQKKERQKMKQIYKLPIKSKDIQWLTSRKD
jgi:hypothetical protein